MTFEDRVDFLEHAQLGAGRLGMTSVPGRCYAMRDPEPLLRDMEAMQALTVHRIVCLLPRYELASLDAGKLPELAPEYGIAFSHHPIVDGHAPERMDPFAELVALAVDELAGGKTLIVHCRAGFGRTGTFAACCLVHRGVAPREAIVSVRALRAYAVETRAQERFVEKYAEDYASFSR